MRLLISILMLAVFTPSFIFSQNRPANELGKILIPTYHVIGDKDSSYTRKRESFWQDLQTYYQDGYYPVRISELKDMNFPRGKKPLVITFDDSSKSQMEMTEDGRITEDCAVGMMEKFKKLHPDFPLTATFFILPGAKSPNNLFGQTKWTAKKLEFLILNGYEVQNHTLWHANLKKYKDKIEEQIGESQRYLNKFIPAVKMTALALPFGIYPPEKYRQKLLRGTFKEINYRHNMVFDYSNRMTISPYSKEYDPLYMRRVQAFEGNIQRFLKRIRDGKYEYYISDGNPQTITIPEGRKEELSAHSKKRFKIIEN